MVKLADSAEAIACVRTPVSAAISSRGPMLSRDRRRAMSSANGTPRWSEMEIAHGQGVQRMLERHQRGDLLRSIELRPTVWHVAHIVMICRGLLIHAEWCVGRNCQTQSAWLRKAVFERSDPMHRTRHWSFIFSLVGQPNQADAPLPRMAMFGAARYCREPPRNV